MRFITGVVTGIIVGSALGMAGAMTTDASTQRKLEKSGKAIADSASDIYGTIASKIQK